MLQVKQVPPTQTSEEEHDANEPSQVSPAKRCTFLFSPLKSTLAGDTFSIRKISPIIENKDTVQESGCKCALEAFAIRASASWAPSSDRAASDTSVVWRSRRCWAS
eukprot:1877367-Rhodomonas_salina.2